MNPVDIHAGRVLLLAGPRAGGKTHLAKQLLAQAPNFSLARGVVTRPSRGIQDNNDQHVSLAEFHRLRGELCLQTTVNGHWYGYLRRAIDNDVNAGKLVLLPLLFARDVDYSRGLWPSATSVYLRPSVSILRRRLAVRHPEITPQELEHRLAEGREVMEQLDTLSWDLFLDVSDDQDVSAVVRRYLSRDVVKQ